MMTPNGPSLSPLGMDHLTTSPWAVEMGSGLRNAIEQVAANHRAHGTSPWVQEGLLYLPPGARFQELLELPDGADTGARLNEAMALIEQSNGKLAGVPPRSYTLEAIEAQGWSLNPGRYVGVAAGEDLSDEDFKEQLQKLQEELEGLNAQAMQLEATIAVNGAGILET
jgi:type I restriction-modification system DNA methylase subunit